MYTVHVYTPALKCEEDNPEFSKFWHGACTVVEWPQINTHMINQLPQPFPLCSVQVHGHEEKIIGFQVPEVH
jgi:hypothetical protein